MTSAHTRLLWLLAGSAAVLAVLACLTVMRQRALDHDEIEHAHAVWLMSLGDRPYTDFFEVHPPFGWMAMVPFVRGMTDAGSITLLLRAISGIGQALTILLLCANMRLGRRHIHPLWIAAAMLTMLTSAGILDHFAELRTDAWANAALLGAILIARSESLPLPWRYAAFGLLASASQLFSPKLPVLLAFFVAIELLRLARESLREAMLAAAAMLSGLAAAVALAALILHKSGIDPSLAYTMTVRYHVLLARGGGWGFGLARTILDQWAISGPAMAGLVIWLVAIVRRQLRPNSFEIAVALFLLAELLLVPFPYKQYFAPWLLLAAVFIPYWSVLTDRIRLIRVMALPVAIVAVLVAALFALDHARFTHGFDRTGAYWRLMAGQGGANRHIVARVDDHPITARDALYAWVGTTGPVREHGPEAILRELDLAEVSPRFTYPRYWRELTTTRPDVVVLGPEPDPAFPQKEAAVADFLRTYAAEYDRRVVDGRTVFVRR